MIELKIIELTRHDIEEKWGITTELRKDDKKHVVISVDKTEIKKTIQKGDVILWINRANTGDMSEDGVNDMLNKPLLKLKMVVAREREYKQTVVAEDFEIQLIENLYRNDEPDMLHANPVKEEWPNTPN